MELWKEISGYPNYQVSNYGNVRSLNWGNTGVCKNLFLKPHNKGYLQVELTKGKNRKTFLVHRLVANAFIPNVNGCSQVNHIDENKRNNNVTNLEWCNQSHNIKAYYLNHIGKTRTPRHERDKRNACKIIQTTLNDEIIREWEYAIDIKHELNYNSTSIWECCEGKRKTAYGYKWHYANEYNNEQGSS